MKRRMMVACLTVSGLFGTTTMLQAQSDSTYHHNYQSQSHYTAKKDGKAKTVKRTGIGAGAGAAIGAIAGHGKGAAIGAAAGGAAGYAYDRHKKHQVKRNEAR
ncbi:MAG TPA: YMGG-like glycine zipper-containing protein [Bryobacteraceae bacterium]